MGASGATTERPERATAEGAPADDGDGAPVAAVDGADDGRTEDDAPARRRPGRPRDARADEAIVDATLDLLVELGFGGITIDAVAQRAGVGKATIYRRWDGKEQLVLDALTQGRREPEIPDTGNLRDDLIAHYGPLGDTAAQEAAVRLMPALAAEAALSADIAERLRAFVADRRRPVATILERAQARGELPAEFDAELTIDLLTGPLMYRLYFTRSRVDRDLIAELVDRALAGVAR